MVWSLLFILSQRLSDERFLEVLEMAHDREPERKIMLRADRDVRYGRVRRLFR